MDEKACDLFLKNRSASIKQSLRQLRIEGATSMYITKLCGVFFNHIIETGKEFRFTFSENQGCFSGKITIRFLRTSSGSSIFIRFMVPKWIFLGENTI